MIQTIDSLSKEILDFEVQLQSNIPATLWISDLHGEGDRFLYVLRGRFGMLFQTCLEALPKTFSKEKLGYITDVIEREKFFRSNESFMDIQDVIQSLITVLRYRIGTNYQYLQGLFDEEIKDLVLLLFIGKSSPSLIFENELIARRVITTISKAIKKILVDHIFVLGDIFDRGPQPDKIIRLLASGPYKDKMSLVFGNHDILWMGACAGNQSLIAEALRITCRYDHMDFLNRMRIDISKLQDFAVRTYPEEKVKGKFKAKTSEFRSMEKALAVIQFKLEEQCIKQHPEYKMQSRMWLDRLSERIQKNQWDGFLDCHFPTIQHDYPSQLSTEEQEVFDDLVQQFLDSKPLRRLIQFSSKKEKSMKYMGIF